MSTYFNWIDFYMEFATKLLEYKNDRKTMIQKIRKVFDEVGMKLPKLDTNGIPKDMDPFTVFGLFNKSIKDENRIRILEGIASEFGVAADVPNDFSGIPVLNPMKATFYGFEDDDRRTDDDIDNLWAVLDSAIALAKKDSQKNREIFSKHYDKALTQIGVKWNITMGLYWIRPYQYLNLDSRNRWFMSDSKHISEDVVAEVKPLKTVPSAEQFLKICDLCHDALADGKYDYTNFPELSYRAWETSTDNKEKYGSWECDESEMANAFGDAEISTVHYWLYAPGEGAYMWDDFYGDGIMALGWSASGNLKQYDSKEEIKNALRANINPDYPYMHPGLMLWQFANEMKPGDIILAKKGRSEIIGRGIVESDYYYDEEREDYQHVRKVKWTDKGHWQSDEMFAMKTLTDVTNYQEFVETIMAMIGESAGNVDKQEKLINYPPYNIEDFLKDVYISEEDYHSLVAILQNKKNIILQGAPGVGKTFIAKRLAYSIMGERNIERVMMIQFHQSYSYEDFIMGFRPSASGFELKKGAFYNFCKRAEEDSDNDYFFIIDEINRGNLSKIFGELFMLIEKDKRGSKNKLQLLYSDELFYVPDNLYIIGMMNTADRSLALLDYALRRRFAFFNLKPGFESDGFRAYRTELDDKRFDKLIHCVEELNQSIQTDESLGEGFCIGHSFFCNLSSENLDEDSLTAIVEYELIPLLKEYWFDEPLKVKEWSENLRSAIK